jgi:hypothetical protein
MEFILRSQSLGYASTVQLNYPSMKLTPWKGTQTPEKIVVDRDPRRDNHEPRHSFKEE